MIAYPHRAEALVEDPAVDGIAITNEMSRCPIPREGLGQLSGDPLGGRIGRDVDPYEPTTRQADND